MRARVRVQLHAQDELAPLLPPQVQHHHATWGVASTAAAGTVYSAEVLGVQGYEPGSDETEGDTVTRRWGIRKEALALSLENHQPPPRCLYVLCSVFYYLLYISLDYGTETSSGGLNRIRLNPQFGP